MKPVLIQTLIKNKQKQRRLEPLTEKELEHHRNRAADFVFWFVIALVIAGLIIA